MWLADGAAAKAVVRARVGATIVDLARELAADAGIDPGGRVAPFLSPDVRTKATEDAIRAVLRAVDLEGLERQAVAATRARARARGTGPMGRITSLVYQLSGRETKVADPTGYLVRWRDRAPLSPAVESLRGALGSALAGASPTVRPALAASLDPNQLRQGLERSIDRALANLDRLEAPSSRWWSLFGLLQTLATVAIAVSAAWVVLWILARPPIDSVDLPLIGTVPIPFVALIASIARGLRPRTRAGCARRLAGPPLGASSARPGRRLRPPRSHGTRIGPDRRTRGCAEAVSDGHRHADPPVRPFLTGAATSRPVGQPEAIAFCLRASNSASVMVPAARSSWSLASWSATDTEAAAFAPASARVISSTSWAVTLGRLTM